MNEKHAQPRSDPAPPVPHDEPVERHVYAHDASRNPASESPPSNQQDHYPSLSSALHPRSESHANPGNPHSSIHRRHAELTTRLRSRFEALPPSILEEAHTLREQMRYFLTSNGHAHGLDDMAPNTDDKVPRSLRELFDEISQDTPDDGERFGERMKDEIWEDDYTRNVSSISSGQCGRDLTVMMADSLCTRFRKEYTEARRRGGRCSRGSCRARPVACGESSATCFHFTFEPKLT